MLGKKGLKKLSSTVIKELKPSKSKKKKTHVKKAKPIKTSKQPAKRKLKSIKINLNKIKIANQLSFEKPTRRSSNQDRVPTGIPGLDEVMAGGYELGSDNLVAGGAGSGKSIYGIQFLVTGIVKYKEPGIYVTFEEKKENVYKHMLTFGWDLAKYEAAGLFAFVEYTPEQVKKMLEEGGGLIESLIHKLNAKRLVIDSITAFSLLFKDELSKRQAVLALFDFIRKWGVTAVLTAEFEPELENPGSATIEFEVDSIVLLYYPRKGDIRKRALEILKMRGTEHSKKIFPLKIAEKGIMIYPKERIF